MNTQTARTVQALAGVGIHISKATCPKCFQVVKIEVFKDHVGRCDS